MLDIQFANYNYQAVNLATFPIDLQKSIDNFNKYFFQLHQAQELE